jgi:hypothetical protein
MAREGMRWIVESLGNLAYRSFADTMAHKECLGSFDGVVDKSEGKYQFGWPPRAPYHSGMQLKPKPYEQSDLQIE